MGVWNRLRLLLLLAGFRLPDGRPHPWRHNVAGPDSAETFALVKSILTTPNNTLNGRTKTLKQPKVNLNQRVVVGHKRAAAAAAATRQCVCF